MQKFSKSSVISSFVNEDSAANVLGRILKNNLYLTEGKLIPNWKL